MSSRHDVGRAPASRWSPCVTTQQTPGAGRLPRLQLLPVAPWYSRSPSWPGFKASGWLWGPTPHRPPPSISLDQRVRSTLLRPAPGEGRRLEVKPRKCRRGLCPGLVVLDKPRLRDAGDWWDGRGAGLPQRGVRSLLWGSGDCRTYGVFIPNPRSRRKITGARGLQ